MNAAKHDRDAVHVPLVAYQHQCVWRDESRYLQTHCSPLTANRDLAQAGFLHECNTPHTGRELTIDFLEIREGKSVRLLDQWTRKSGFQSDSERLGREHMAKLRAWLKHLSTPAEEAA